MGLQSFLEHCAKNAIRPTFANRSKNPPKRADTYKGGYGGATGYSCLCGKYIASWNYLSAEQYFLELRGRGAIRPTTWNFMCLAQYNQPPPASRLASLGKSALPLVARIPRQASPAFFATPPNSRGSAKGATPSALPQCHAS